MFPNLTARWSHGRRPDCLGRSAGRKRGHPAGHPQQRHPRHWLLCGYDPSLAGQNPRPRQDPHGKSRLRSVRYASPFPRTSREGTDIQGSSAGFTSCSPAVAAGRCQGTSIPNPDTPQRNPAARGEGLPPLILTIDNGPDGRMLAGSFPPRHPTSRKYAKQWGCLCKPLRAASKNVFL